ncbi:MAG: ABC-F family ATP-binding cassette domain-containing protein [Bacilli bacterium]|nr:ABC-F family ATP-binding cassette domain-containing protein [Bacilli bacterium]
MKGSNLNLSFGLEQIYVNANFQLNDFDKVGVVGVNGAGKTTLFKVILKEQELDSGKIKIVNKNIGYLPQEIILENKDITVFEYIMSARPIDKLNKKLIELYNEVAITSGKEQEIIMKKISKVQAELEYYDCYNAENILLELISDMQIDFELLDMRLCDLSGGQKSKVAFAHLLYSKPEILLLDEPTNHLDVTTREFITNYLKKYKGMVLIISHDVDFLNKIVNKILYVNKVNKSLTVYDGNYDVYKKKLEDEKEFQNRLIDKQEKEIKELQEFVEKAKKASRTNHNLKKMGKDREIKLARKLEELGTRERVYRKIRLNIKPNREGSKIPLKVNNITFNYPEKDKLYNNLSFVINNRERFLIVGENGVGKSTLLKLIVGKLKPNEGSIWYGSKTDIAYYAQELELLDDNKTILENVDTKGYSDKELRTLLGNFLFYGDDVFKKIRVLSPGEKARVTLCKIMLERANLLILDEPTNHLDPETQVVIAENFKNYEGTIIMVSHNPVFTSHIDINRMLILPQGKITNYSEEKLNYYYKLNTKN